MRSFVITAKLQVVRLIKFIHVLYPCRLVVALKQLPPHSQQQFVVIGIVVAIIAKIVATITPAVAKYTKKKKKKKTHRDE